MPSKRKIGAYFVCVFAILMAIATIIDYSIVYKKFILSEFLLRIFYVIICMGVFVLSYVTRNIN
jgi:hypothetical protein